LFYMALPLTTKSITINKVIIIIIYEFKFKTPYKNI